MTNPLSFLKKRMSTLHKDAWHARLSKFAFGKHARQDKACPYWWVVVPTSLPVAGLKLLLYAGLLLVGGVIWVAWLLVSCTAWFLGRTPNYWRFDQAPVEKHRVRYFRSYKSGGERFAPFQIALALVAPIGVLTGLVWASGSIHDFFTDNGKWILVAVLSVAGLFVLGVIYRHFVAPFLKRKYTEWCPEITWLDGEEPQEDQELVNA